MRFDRISSSQVFVKLQAVVLSRRVEGSQYIISRILSASLFLEQAIWGTARSQIVLALFALVGFNYNVVPLVWAAMMGELLALSMMIVAA